MTQTADGYDGEVLQFAGADEDRDRSNDHVPFQLAGDDTIYEARRPKIAVLLRCVKALGDDQDELAQVAAFDDLLDRILEPESAAALRERLEDDDDDLDLDSPGIANMFQTLVGLWYGRPTGRRPASRRSPSRTGRRSTGPAPSGE